MPNSYSMLIYYVYKFASHTKLHVTAVNKQSIETHKYSQVKTESLSKYKVKLLE